MIQDAITRKIVRFINEIGLEVVEARLKDGTFLPSILIERGRIPVDETRLKFPGDLLHEAVHLVVAPGNLRFNLKNLYLIKVI